MCLGELLPAGSEPAPVIPIPTALDSREEVTCQTVHQAVVSELPIRRLMRTTQKWAVKARR